MDSLHHDTEPMQHSLQLIDIAVAAAKREERKALKALARLCDQAMPIEDARTVDEVRALPGIEVVETE